jgi:hypothetical protein
MTLLGSEPSCLVFGFQKSNKGSNSSQTPSTHTTLIQPMTPPHKLQNTQNRYIDHLCTSK